MVWARLLWDGLFVGLDNSASMFRGLRIAVAGECQIVHGAVPRSGWGSAIEIIYLTENRCVRSVMTLDVRL